MIYSILIVSIINFAFANKFDFKSISYKNENDSTIFFEILSNEVTNNQFVKYLNSALQKGEIKIDEKHRIIGYYSGDVYYNEGSKVFAFLDGDNKMDHIIFNNNLFELRDSNYANHPVTKISWYCANAFAIYYDAMLPSAIEWEKAAEYIKIKQKINLVYYKEKINFNSGKLKPVNDYDLFGNVSEWTRSIDNEIKSFKLIKGASFKDSNEKFLDLNYNKMNFANQTLNDTGFRIVKYSK